MAHFDDIYDIAIDNYGLVTASQAKEEGVTAVELNRWCKSGRLEKRGYGVYKLTRWVPTPNDGFAEALALVGEGSYLRGTAVLSMHELALVNPRTIKVATTKRVRRKLPSWIATVPAKNSDHIMYYEGIRSQRVADAIRECKQSVMSERLVDAIKQAKQKGLITAREYDELEKEPT